tara:strand:- start:8862 stop:9998 length:1137 start_codon:yes stop_codon:yes gene_type:complete
MFKVYSHWDKLETCIVGKTYPAEFYSWIDNKKTRSRFEQLATETEEDYQNLISVLKDRFGVNVVRPEFPDNINELYIDGKWVQPPTAPRDYFLMIRDKFWVPSVPNASHAWNLFYRKNKQPDWKDYVRPEDFAAAHPNVDDFWERFKTFQKMDQKHLDAKLGFYGHIFDKIKQSGTEIQYTDLDFINGCFVSRLGDKLFFATQTYHDTEEGILEKVNALFPDTINKVVPAEGHGDAVYCPVTPGLIISINDMPTYKDTFPGWEVVYLPNSTYNQKDKFEASMRMNKGKWFLPGFEKDPSMIDLVEHYFDEWVGQASETVFHVNILVVDPKNIIVSSYSEKVADACKRYGITMHVVPFRHKYFWDAGIHCITNDINRIP